MYITAGSSTGDIYQYSLTTPYDLTTISYDGTMDLSTIITGFANGRSINFNSDGTKAYVSIISGSSFHDTIFEIDLSTAWDTRTASYNSISLLIESPNVYHEGVAFKPDGTKFWTISRQYDKVYAYTMTTAFDLSTASYDTVEFSVTTQASTPYDLYFKSDGTKMYILDGNDSVYEYDLSTAWDITSSTYNNISFSLANETTSPKGIFMDANGLYLFVAADDTETVYKYSIGSITHPYSQYIPALTNSSTGQINSSSWLDINSMTADETKNDGDIFYAVSTDNRTSWGVAKASTGVRKIARNNSGTWQYNNDSGTSETWVNGTNNNEHATLQEVLGAQSFNRMDKAQLDAVADDYHFSQDSADTLDLMIAPYAASGSSPISDGVTINYDAGSKYRQAVPETDYRVDFQGTSTVEFTSNISANFKVKVV
jgi:hypothetical protein